MGEGGRGYDDDSLRGAGSMAGKEEEVVGAKCVE